MRRASDRPAIASTVLGFALGGVAIYLHRDGASEWMTLAVLFLAGVLVRGESVIGLARLWKKNNRHSGEQPKP